MACFLRCGSFGRHGEIFAEQNKKLIQQNASAQLGKTDTGEGEPAQLCQKSAEFFDFREVVLIQKTDLIKKISNGLEIHAFFQKICIELKHDQAMFSVDCGNSVQLAGPDKKKITGL